MKPNHIIDVPDALRDLNGVYEAAGHTLWFVGGCVRDALKGVACKDVDLATTATPEQQIAICDAAGLRWFGTGLQHGTITVLTGGEPYEITTLRRDVETDGRHAEVEWSTDIAVDLGRRDLTINAMAMTFDGELVDPFGGCRDLSYGRVRFVGDAERRIDEDHLRIMRWLRFQGRFGTNVGRHGGPSGGFPGDFAAITRKADLLKRISVERIWSETARILTGPNTMTVIDLMYRSGTLTALGLARGEILHFRNARNRTDDPAALLAFWQGDAATDVLERWKASGAERDAAAYVAARLGGDYGVVRAKRDLVDGGRRDLVLALLATRHGLTAVADMAHWVIPVFPLQGRDLLAAGMKPGKAVGETLASLRADWEASDYQLTADALMASVPVEAR